MKKIKKSVAVVAALLLMSSGNIDAKNKVIDVIKIEADCHDQVHMTVVQADATGNYTEEEIAWISNAALAIYCYGYSLEDVLGAQ